MVLRQSKWDHMNVYDIHDDCNTRGLQATTYILNIVSTVVDNPKSNNFKIQWAISATLLSLKSNGTFKNVNAHSIEIVWRIEKKKKLKKWTHQLPTDVPM